MNTVKMAALKQG